MGSRTRSQNRPSGSVHGVLVVDKPQGITSHGVVNHVRRAFGTRRVGHAGTLDPMATGVLVLLLGEATKLSSILTTEKKTYEACVHFGSATDSLDADGTTTKTVHLEPDWLDRPSLDAAIEFERARRLQIPPQVSAIKVDGQRAYARARKGQTTQLAPRDVAVHELRLLEVMPFAISFRLCVSKGYYVRSLAHDLGQALGVPAHLSSLRRVQSGLFTIEMAQPWPVDPTAPLLPLGETVRRAIASVSVTEEGRLRLSQGKRLNSEHLSEAEPNPLPPLLAAFHGNAIIALIEPCEGGEFRVKRGMNDPSTQDQVLLPSPKSE